MSSQLRVTDPREIPKLVDLIHDLWLDAESIKYDPQNSILDIRYLKEQGSPPSFVSRVRFPAFECHFRVSNVVSFSVRDTEKVRYYDINTVTYDPNSKSVTVETGIPIEIRAVVDALDLTAQETDALVKD